MVVAEDGRCECLPHNAKDADYVPKIIFLICPKKFLPIFAVKPNERKHFVHSTRSCTCPCQGTT